MHAPTPIFTGICNILAAGLLLAALYFGLLRGDGATALWCFAVAAPLPGMSYIARARSKPDAQSPRDREDPEA